MITTVGILGWILIHAIGRTWRWEIHGLEHFKKLETERIPIIYAFWHGRILSATYYFRRRGIVVITSENFDGEWIARIIERFGYGTARGSTTRGGLKAMHQLVRNMREGRPAGFTLDGPRGPARVAQPGAVWLAAHTGNPLLPFHLEASSYWSVRNWDRTQIPKPFSTVALVVGEPIEVAKGSKDDALEVVRAGLEGLLASLEQRARALLVT